VRHFGRKNGGSGWFRRMDLHQGGKGRQPVTELLIAWSGGDEKALQRLLPLVYQELRRQAARYFRQERRDHTLQATALVHEAFVKLVDQRRVQWRNRSHFFAVSATLMRRILVDHARRRRYLKRGGAAGSLRLDDVAIVASREQPDLVALDDALKELAELDAEQSRIVELRFFGGLSHQEIADALGLSVPTIERRWRLARAWLFERLAASGPAE